MILSTKPQPFTVLVITAVLITKVLSKTGQPSVCPASTGSAYLDLRSQNVTLTSSTMTHLFLNATFPCKGRVHQWTYYRTHRTPTIFASVWRKEETPAGYFRLVGKNVLPPSELGRHTVTVKEKDKFDVRQGDFIGFFYSNMVYKYNDPGAIAVIRTNQTGDRSLVYSALLAGYFDENFNVDMPHTFHTNDRTEMLLQPAIEAHLEYSHVLNNFSISTIACRGRTASLVCPNSTITVHAASYGRTQVACGIRSLAMGCKADVTSLVQDECREKTSCRFLVDDTVFGDPCFGLDEFLEVDYSCNEEATSLEPPTIISEHTTSAMTMTDSAVTSSSSSSSTTTSVPTISSSSTTISSTITTSTTIAMTTTKVSWLPWTTTTPRLEFHSRSTGPSKSVETDKGQQTSTQSTISTTQNTPASSTLQLIQQPGAGADTDVDSNHNATDLKPSVPMVPAVTVTTMTADPPPATGFTYVVQNLGTVIGGVIAGLVFLALLLITFFICKRTHKKPESNKLVQCRLLEPHLRRNPLYAPPGGTTLVQSPYQISTLQHHYERINSLTRKHGHVDTEDNQQPRPKYFYSIPNKKRVRKGSTEEMIKKNTLPEENSSRLVKHTEVMEPVEMYPSDLPPQRPKSLELPPLPTLRPVEIDTELCPKPLEEPGPRLSWTPSATFPRFPLPVLQRQQQAGGGSGGGDSGAGGSVAAGSGAGGSTRETNIYETVSELGSEPGVAEANTSAH